MSAVSSDEVVDLAMHAWRQGDYVIGDVDFFFVDHAGNVVAELCRGYMVVSQTCDIVRSVSDREFLEVAALTEIPASKWPMVKKGQVPRFAAVLPLSAERLAADLDRVMTVTKHLVAAWGRTAGCSSEVEERSLRYALGRKRTRPAFPDDLNGVLEPLRKRWVEKHNKSSAEGRALSTMREIRIAAAPSWDASTAAVTIYLIWDARSDASAHASIADTWRALVVGATGRFSLRLVTVALDDLGARAYVDSDPLDLDHLTLMSVQ